MPGAPKLAYFRISLVLVGGNGYSASSNHESRCRLGKCKRVPAELSSCVAPIPVQEHINRRIDSSLCFLSRRSSADAQPSTIQNMSGKHVAEQAGCEHRICSPEEPRSHTRLEVTAKDAMRHLRASLKPDFTCLVKSQAFGKHKPLEGQVPVVGAVHSKFKDEAFLDESTLSLILESLGRLRSQILVRSSYFRGEQSK
jgi:hypothetical protein